VGDNRIAIIARIANNVMPDFTDDAKALSEVEIVLNILSPL
jgi:hypothetical protein